MAVFGTEPAILAYDQIAAADRRHEAWFNNGPGCRFVDDYKCSFIQRVRVMRPALDPAWGMAQTLKRGREPTHIAEPFHPHSRFRRRKFIAGLDHDEVPPRNTKKLGEDSFLAAVIGLDCMDRQYDIYRVRSERNAFEVGAEQPYVSMSILAQMLLREQQPRERKI